MTQNLSKESTDRGVCSITYHDQENEQIFGYSYHKDYPIRKLFILIQGLFPETPDGQGGYYVNTYNEEIASRDCFSLSC